MQTNSTQEALPSIQILWGRKVGSEDWQEAILCTQPARFAEVRALASRDGFAHFRESVDNGTAPNFARAISA